MVEVAQEGGGDLEGEGDLAVNIVPASASAAADVPGRSDVPPATPTITCTHNVVHARMFGIVRRQVACLLMTLSPPFMLTSTLSFRSCLMVVDAYSPTASSRDGSSEAVRPSGEVRDSVGGVPFSGLEVQPGETGAVHETVIKRPQEKEKVECV